MAVLSFVLGIVGMLFGCTAWVGLVLGVAGLALGIVHLIVKGKNVMAIIGIALSAVALIFGIIGVAAADLVLEFAEWYMDLVGEFMPEVQPGTGTPVPGFGGGCGF